MHPALAGPRQDDSCAQWRNLQWPLTVVIGGVNLLSGGNSQGDNNTHARALVIEG